MQTYRTGFPRLDAQTDFRRARRAHSYAKIGRFLRLRGSCSRPAVLSDSAARVAGPRRLEVVPLRAIVGTVDPTANFDSGFRPASEAVRQRWERIALAHRRGDSLPPVVLWRQTNGYYVLDGRHRISVARTLGLSDVDAWVTGPRQ